MSTIISQQIINSSTAEVEAYVGKANTLFAELEGAINALTSSGFIGEAADGYKTFFTSKILPALTTNLTEGEASLMGALKKMMDEIGHQFLVSVDPALGEANEGAGQQ